MGGGAGPLSEETIIKLSISVAFAMRCTVAMCIAALFLLMGPASMAQSGRVVGRGTTLFGTNPGGKYVYRGGATFGTNPGGKYVYRGGDAKFHTNPGGKNSLVRQLVPETQSPWREIRLFRLVRAVVSLPRKVGRSWL